MLFRALCLLAVGANATLVTQVLHVTQYVYEDVHVYVDGEGNPVSTSVNFVATTLPASSTAPPPPQATTTEGPATTSAPPPPASSAAPAPSSAAQHHSHADNEMSAAPFQIILPSTSAGAAPSSAPASSAAPPPPPSSSAAPPPPPTTSQAPPPPPTTSQAPPPPPSSSAAPPPPPTTSQAPPPPPTTSQAPAPTSSKAAPAPSSSSSGGDDGAQGSGKTYSGDATYYDVGLGACGITNTDDDLIVALNADQFGAQSNGNPVCNKKIVINRGDKSVTVTVTDKCPGCKYGDLDLSPAAYKQLGTEDEGRFKITWQFAE